MAAGAVAALFAQLGERPPDAEVVDYLCATVADEDTDVDSLLDCLLGFSPALGQLPPAQQTELAGGLLEDARAAAAAGAAQQQQPAAAAPLSAAAPPQQGLSKLSISERSASGAAAGSRGPSSSRGGSGCSTPSAAAAAGQADAPAAAPASEAEVAAVDVLRALCPLPDADPGFLLHLLRSRGGGRLEAAATWLLDAADTLPAEQEAWRRGRAAAAAAADRAAAEREELRKQIVSKYQLEAVPSGSVGAGGGAKKRQELLAWQGKEAASKARYRDGQLVSTKGEKYIVERVSEEWDGGSKGKVYSKGKRGKGFY